MTSYSAIWLKSYLLSWPPFSDEHRGISEKEVQVRNLILIRLHAAITSKTIIICSSTSTKILTNFNKDEDYMIMSQFSVLFVCCFSFIFIFFFSFFRAFVFLFLFVFFSFFSFFVVVFFYLFIFCFVFVVVFWFIACLFIFYFFWSFCRFGNELPIMYGILKYVLPFHDPYGSGVLWPVTPVSSTNKTANHDIPEI